VAECGWDDLVELGAHMNSSEQYQQKNAVRFIDSLGDGKDGRVFKTSQGNAVKFLNDASIYRRELQAYQILRQRDIEQINGFQVPRLVRWDDSFLAIEMTTVRPPFILDFASAYTIDEYNRFDFTAEIIEEREQHWAEVFGDRWAIVQEITNAFTSATGLILLDLSLNNIKFAD
jgi:hypothetical protein